MSQYQIPVGPRPKPYLDEPVRFAQELHYHLSHDGADARIDHFFLHDRVLQPLGAFLALLPPEHKAAATELQNDTVDTLNEMFMLGIAHGVAAEAFRQSLLRIDAEVRHPEREGREAAKLGEWDYWEPRRE